MCPSHRMDRRVRTLCNTEELDLIPGLSYSEEELTGREGSLQAPLPSRSSRSPAAAEPRHLRRGRARSPTPIGERSRRFIGSPSPERSPTHAPTPLDPGRSLLSEAIVTGPTHSAQDALRSQVGQARTRPINIPRFRHAEFCLRDSTSELYGESDDDFQAVVSSLSISIKQDPMHMEKWELPPPSSVG